MNLFETVKTAISVRQAAERYGLIVGKNGHVLLPLSRGQDPVHEAQRSLLLLLRMQGPWGRDRPDRTAAAPAAGKRGSRVGAGLPHGPQRLPGPGKRAKEAVLPAGYGRPGPSAGRHPRKGHHSGAGCMAQACTEGADHVSAAAPDVEGALCPSPWGRMSGIRCFRRRASGRHGWRGCWPRSDDPLERDFLYDACKKEVDAIAERITRDQLGTAHERERAG